MLVEALEHLVRGIVDNPDDVSVRSREARGGGGRDRDRGARFSRGETLEVRVNPDGSLTLVQAPSHIRTVCHLLH